MVAAAPPSSVSKKPTPQLLQGRLVSADRYVPASVRRSVAPQDSVELYSCPGRYASGKLRKHHRHAGGNGVGLANFR